MKKLYKCVNFILTVPIFFTTTLEVLFRRYVQWPAKKVSHHLNVSVMKALIIVVPELQRFYGRVPH
jgi:hypothetical protein